MESDDDLTDCQPQYPDLQDYFNTGFTGVQAVFITTRHLPALTRCIHSAYSVIEEIVEGFVEDFLDETDELPPTELRKRLSHI